MDQYARMAQWLARLLFDLEGVHLIPSCGGHTVTEFMASDKIDVAIYLYIVVPVNIYSPFPIINILNTSLLTFTIEYFDV